MDNPRGDTVPNGEIIDQGHNRVYDEGDFTSHAEMEAIRVAGRKLMSLLTRQGYLLCDPLVSFLLE